ncbi:MAG: CotH kinase family protein [Saprospiraceae bacterium]|nr:CotH kinase family protein [Saprospiraceae bacterium]
MKLDYLFVTALLYISNIGAQQTFYELDQIQTIEITFAESNWDQILDSLKATTEGYLSASEVVINSSPFLNVGVKYKGNSSYDATSLKNPLHISLDKFQDQNYQNIKDIKLSNCYDDPSMIREVLSYQILNDYMECPQANFAKVFVNGSYMGLYSNVEDISKSFCADRFFSKKGNTFFKCSPVVKPGPNTKSNLKYLSADSTAYYNLYELKSNSGWSDLISLANTVSNNPTAAPNELDLDRIIWMLAYNNLLVNLDSYSGAFCQNYYLYKDNTGLFNPIIWDLNLSFGGLPFAGSSNSSLGSLSKEQMQQLPIALHANDPYWPLINIIMKNATYKKMYVAHLKTIHEEVFQNDQYLSLAQSLQSLIREAAEQDNNKFFSYQAFLNGLNEDQSVGNYVVPGIQNLINGRKTYLSSTAEFNYLQPIISTPRLIFSKTDSMCLITVSSEQSQSVFLGFRFNYATRSTLLPMYDDGLHGDGLANDHIYGLSIKSDPVNSQFYIYAENDNAGSFSPARAAFKYYTINELNTTHTVKQTHSIVFNNPFSNELTIHSIEDHPSELIIYNELGIKIHQSNFFDQTSINTHYWKPGLYFIKLNHEIEKALLMR